jgi:Xaa-Pro aminopeptidase
MATKNSFAERLAALRGVMSKHGVDACVVPSSDPHLSEYLPPRWQARRWLSGFGGSAGTLVVTSGFAGLWTDSRYWEQADHDLADTGIATMRAGAADVPGIVDWLANALQAGAVVAVDGQVLDVHTHRHWSRSLESRGITLDTGLDLVGEIWSDRPGLPAAPVYPHEPPFACRGRAGNIAQVRQAMAEHGADWHWIASLDDVAWLLNLRGGDVSYNPVFLAYVLVGKDTARLFVACEKIDANLKAALLADGVAVEPYEAAAAALAALSADSTLLIDPVRVTAGALQSASAALVEATNPSHMLKSRKNAAEIDNVRRTMEQDGAALCEFFSWFDAAQGIEHITELTIDEKITAARARRPNFVSPSFATIAAYNANGAMPHYQATEASFSEIAGDGLLLIDSGGQYLGGTTDITRVVPVGRVSPAQKRDFTTVLKGMIALSLARFPRGTASPMLDTLARAPIWRTGADFGHGTGHGVGYFLNVHEGPQAIAYRAAITPQRAMEPGMITSNEPGLYRPGKWGIRIENLVLNVPAETTEFGEFLQFETLTLCPIDTRCIDVPALDGAERDWLNHYHAQVRERLSPLVDGAAQKWLVERTEPV